MAITTEQIAQRLHDCGLLTTKQLNDVFGSFSTRSVSVEEFQQQLLRKELVTNWQLDRILGGHMVGYFYGEYKVLYIVGAGTFARVYRCEHRKTGDLKAVKVLRQRYSQELDTIDRFLQEAKTVMKLRHPNIVPIYEIDQERGRHYMVMDFIEGQNLRDYVRVQGHLKYNVALNIARDVAAGLEYAASQGITHRDLKMSNVLLSSLGRASLVDFGLATIQAESGKSGDFITNPRSIDYAGLERATGVRRDDKRSDIFFLGCMIYNMVSGKPALYETKERIQRLSISRYKEIPPITTIAPDLPHRIVVMLHKMMELNPESRLQSPTEALREINSVIEALERGDTAQYDETRDNLDSQKRTAESEFDQEGNNRKVMVIESNLKIQDSLRERLKQVGYRVLIFSDPRRALLRFEGLVGDEEESVADIVIFGCGQIGPECLEAFNFFADNSATSEIPAILLTDETQRHFRDTAKLSDHRINIELPLRLKQLRKAIVDLISSNGAK